VPNIVPGKAKFGGDKKAPKGDEVENPFGTKRGSNVDRPIGGHQPRDLGTEKPIGGSSSSRSEENHFGTKRGSNIDRPIGGHQPRDLGTEKPIGGSSGSSEDNPFGTKRGSNIDRPISTLRKSAETQQSRSLETDSPPLPLDDDVDAIPFGKHKRSGAKLQPPPPPSRKPIAGRPLARPSSSGSIGSNSSSSSPTSTTAGVARGVRPSLPGKPVVAKPAKLLMKKDSVTRTRAAENSTNRRSAEAGDARLVDLTGGTTRKGVRTTTRSC
jgi:hypothetical protein